MLSMVIGTPRTRVDILSRALIATEILPDNFPLYSYVVIQGTSQLTFFMCHLTRTKVV